ncbi:Receptor-type tyrosine-protein phosphatase S [Geodia barretti]|uniref:Receptor-type tyrosine-protein phosphatase S n=1 Tax=Geodia barretti TaxID=519541 RepID=A0AA35XM83_GEOBA|nr:Receptor-type tyrosine-protein phosphatase S [Geodia barretti]
MDSIETSPTITIFWSLPPDVTGSEVSWELTEQTRRRRRVRNAERGTSGPLSADENSYTIDKLRYGTSYDITVTVFNPAGSSSTTFTRSTEGGIPSAPVLDSTPTVTTITITITGSVPSGSVVTGYVVQWQRDTSLVCPDLRDDGGITVTSSSFTGRTITGLEPGNRSDISASGTSYSLDSLEEGTEYSITVSATLTGNGGTQEGSTTATTLTAAPSAPPPGVTVTHVTSSAITVQWGEVPCAVQNGAITGYSVQYGVIGSGNTETVTVSGASTTQTTITVLTVESTTATSLSLSWTSAGSEGVMYEVEWERDTSVGCTDEDTGSTTITGGSMTSYTITGLEEDSSSICPSVSCECNGGELN